MVLKAVNPFVYLFFSLSRGLTPAINQAPRFFAVFAVFTRNGDRKSVV